MALYHFLCGFTVTVFLSSSGCHAQQLQCGVTMQNTSEDGSPGSWPWRVYLQSWGENIGLGSLISDEWVITVGCLIANPAGYEAVLGYYDLSGPNPNKLTVRVVEINIHFETSEHIICLLRLETRVNFTDYIRPICLAAAGSTFHTGTDSWVTSSVSNHPDIPPEVPAEVKVPIVGNNECNCNFGIMTEETICAGRIQEGQYLCEGATGDSAVVSVEGVWVQYGIMTDIYCSPDMPGTYIRVSHYEAWIRGIIEGSKPGFVTFTSPGSDSDKNYTCLTGTSTTTEAKSTGAMTTEATTTEPTTVTSTTTEATSTGAMTTEATTTEPTTVTSTTTEATSTGAMTTEATTTSTTTEEEEEDGDDDDDLCVFAGGESMFHVTTFMSLWVVALSLLFVVG